MYRFLISVIAVFFITQAVNAQCRFPYSIPNAEIASFNPTNLNAFMDTIGANWPCSTYAYIDITVQGLNPDTDTLFITSPIEIKTDKSINAEFQIKSSLYPNKKIIVSRMTSGFDSRVLNIPSSNVTISEFGISHRGTDTNSVLYIAGNGATIKNMHFDLKNSTSKGISLEGSSALINACYFRTVASTVLPTDKPIAIHTTGASINDTIQACLFMSNGLKFQTDGFVLQASTFIGQIGASTSLIEITGDNETPNFLIQHNLIAIDNFSTYPIQTATAKSVTDIIKNNAFASSIPGIIQLSSGGTQRNNLTLPQGFSNYSSGDYPVSQMREDISLHPSLADSGKMPMYFKSFNDSIPDMSTVISSVRPLSGVLWPTGMKVGCFGNFDDVNYYYPSPVTSLTFRAEGGNVTRYANELKYDTAYYGDWRRPTCKYYFYSNTNATLNGSDTTTLNILGNYWDSFCYLNEDNVKSDESMAVPKILRTGADIWVKMVHSYTGGFARDFGKSIVKVSGVKRYPQSDFTVRIRRLPTDSTSSWVNGSLPLEIIAGNEEIKSIGLIAYSIAQGTILQHDTISASKTSHTFGNLVKGLTYVKAYPIGTNDEIGLDTTVTETVDMKNPISPIMYVEPRTNCNSLVEGNGTEIDPYCEFSEAVRKIGNSAVTIIVKWPLAFRDTIRSPFASYTGTAPITMISEVYLEALQNDKKKERPVIEGLTLNKPNITIKGFVLLRPAHIPAATISATNIVLDGNFILSNIQNELISINGTLATDYITIQNNLFYGGNRAIAISSAATIAIKNNTFIDANGSTVGILVEKEVGVTTLGITAHIANNYFSGLAKNYQTPFHGTFLETETITLFRNAFAVSVPNFYGLTADIPALDLARPINESFNPWGGNLFDDAADHTAEVIRCSGNGCSSLFAGSTTEIPFVSTDIFGNARVGKPEVGAFEDQDNEGSYLTYTATEHSKVRGYPTDRSDTIPFTFSSYNYEPTMVPNIYVWWTDDKPDVCPAIDSSRGYVVFPVSSLDPGNDNGIQLSSGISGLDSLGGEFYTVCFGFGKDEPTLNSKKNKIIIQTPVPPDTITCVLADSQECGGFYWALESPAVPDGKGYASFAKPSNATIKLVGGAVTQATQATLPQITLDTTLPSIQVTSLLYASTLPTDSNNNYYTVRFELGLPHVNIHGIPYITNTTELYRLDPSDNKLYYVPTWDTTTVNGNLVINIESRDEGIFYFSTGLAQAPGIATPTQPAGTFNASSPNVALNYTPTGLVTSNPLIMVSVIPAGSIADATIFADNAIAKNHILSSEMAGLGDELRAKWIKKLYAKMAAATPSITPDFGKAPISLAVDYDSYNNASVILPSTPGTPLTFKLGNYVNLDTRRKITRGLEFIFTVFDGGKVTMKRTLWPTSFDGGALGSGDSSKIEFSDKIFLGTIQWRLFSVPWQEIPDGLTAVYKLVGLDNAKEWNDNKYRIWKYDAASNDYMKYSGSNSAAFPFDAGRAVWVVAVGHQKDNLTFTPQSSGGTSLDYQNFTLPVTAGVWNDFGIPFNFPVRWGDVAVTPAVPYTIVKFVPDSVANKATWKAISTADTLFPWQGYSIKPTGATNLIFPVIDAHRSLQPIVKKSALKEGFQIALNVQGSTARTSLLIGDRENTLVRGAFPFIPGQDFEVYLKNTSGSSPFKKLSADIRNSGKKQGCWPIVARFNKGADGLNFKLSETSNLDDSTHVYLVESLSKTVRTLSDSNSVYLSPGQFNDGVYSIAVGSEQYARNLVDEHLLQFQSFPNPFTNSVTLEYNIPESFSSLGALIYDLKVHNISGETVYNKKGHFSPNQYTFKHSWSGINNAGSILPAGYYLITFKLRVGTTRTLKSVQSVIKLR
ncbi:MAG: hypothetical protein HQK83_01605 [Fibrobacteria bacterium]|nr:hypothetical protein [Fibrobacteria bacterium]